MDAEGTEVLFTLKRTTPLRKLFDAFCKRRGIDCSNARFHFDGRNVGLDDTCSAEDFNMEDYDVIDAMIEAIGC